jgi:hypothetical protein
MAADEYAHTGPSAIISRFVFIILYIAYDNISNDMMKNAAGASFSP